MNSEMDGNSKEYFYGATPVVTGDATAYDLWNKLVPVSDPVRIFIGHDEIEEIAYHTLVHSIMRTTTAQVQITPLDLAYLRPILTRQRDPKQSNSFSFSRFLVPWLCNYEGYALYLDCDMMARADIAKLWWGRQHLKAVQVVKHDYVPKDKTKFLGMGQHAYRRKNWSSLILFNCARCKKLTPKYVNSATGLELHQFGWVDDDEVGDLPREWNWLVDEYEYNPAARLVHWTNGGPWFAGNEHVDYSTEWYGILDTMISSENPSSKLLRA